MIRDVTAELLVLRKRAATWILLGIWTALGVFFAYVIPYALDPEDATGGVSQFLPASLPGTVLEGFPFFGGVFALMLGVFALGSEYSWGTLTSMLTQRSGRSRVLAAKLIALAVVLLGYTLGLFAASAVASLVIARVEDASATFPSAWLLLRALAAGWLVMGVWAAVGVLLGVLTRGTSLAIGIGILYALVIEGLLSALADSIGALDFLTRIFLRANGYSLAAALGASRESIASSGPGSFSGPYAGSAQAVGVLVAIAAAAVLGAGLLLRRRDVS